MHHQACSTQLAPGPEVTSLLSEAFPLSARPDASKPRLRPRCSVVASGNKNSWPSVSGEVSRRAAAAQLACAAASPAIAFFWPLPAAGFEATEAIESKRKHLSIDSIKDIIARDIKDGQYFITGNLTRDIYKDDCRFRDPTNETVGLEKYLQAVSILFDPANSKQELLSIAVTSPTTITAKWTLGGYLKFPWRPRVVPFEGSTQYVVDTEGLVALHDEKWSISPLTALLETITPSFGRF